MAQPQDQHLLSERDDELLTLRRENRRLWTEIEARRAADRERTTPTPTAETPPPPMPVAKPPQPTTAQEEPDFLAAISLAIQEECEAMSMALEQAFDRRAVDADRELRRNLNDIYTALAARLDRFSVELHQLREAVEDIREEQRRQRRTTWQSESPADATWRHANEQTPPRLIAYERRQGG